MFRMLSNQHYLHRANQKLRSWANAVFQNRGVCGQAVPSFLSPSPVIHFVLLLSQLSRRTSRGNAYYAAHGCFSASTSHLAIYIPDNLKLEWAANRMELFPFMLTRNFPKQSYAEILDGS